MRLFFFILSFLYTTNSFAENVTPVVGSQVSGNMNALGMILSLMMVLVVIVGSAFLLKRFNLVQNSSSGLKIITSLSLSTKEKLVVVQVGEQQLLLGVTSQQINLLETLTEPLIVKQTKSTPPDKSLLGFFKKAKTTS